LVWLRLTTGNEPQRGNRVFRIDRNATHRRKWTLTGWEQRCGHRYLLTGSTIQVLPLSLFHAPLVVCKNMKPGANGVQQSPGTHFRK
jgi:hypothetical protein